MFPRKVSLHLLGKLQKRQPQATRDASTETHGGLEERMVRCYTMRDGLRDDAKTIRVKGLAARDGN
jgi:hypothetical protein